MLVICAMVYMNPVKRSVMPAYHGAVTNWAAGNDLYRPGVQVGGEFHYLPQFAIVFTPFHLIPSPYGDILWRVLSAALLATGVLRLVRLLFPEQAGRSFFVASALVVLPGLAALRNGQANVMVAACFVHAAASIARGQWMPAALAVAGSLVAKPVSLVFLVMSLSYRRVIFPLLVILAVMAVLPFFFAEMGYVIGQYRLFLENVSSKVSVSEYRFADLTGLLRAIGLDLIPGMSFPVRLLAGIGTLGLWLAGGRAKEEPHRALLLLASTSSYLMLFNPMTEVNSYIIAAPAVALYALLLMQNRAGRLPGWTCVFICVSVGIFPEVFRGLDRDFGLWWDPLAMLLFYAVITADAVRSYRQRFPAQGPFIPEV